MIFSPRTDGRGASLTRPLNIHLALAALALFAPAAAAAADLTVAVSGARSDSGVIRLALCADQRCYEDSGPFIQEAVAPARKAGTAAVFSGLAPGVYALMFYHDENENGSFDKLWIFPNEGFGFSNDARPGFSRPDYEDVRFTLGDADARITVSVQYASGE